MLHSKVLCVFQVLSVIAVILDVLTCNTLSVSIVARYLVLLASGGSEFRYRVNTHFLIVG